METFCTESYIMAVQDPRMAKMDVRRKSYILLEQQPGYLVQAKTGELHNLEFTAIIFTN